VSNRNAKSFEFRAYENTDSKFRLSLNWRNEKLEYDFRIERQGNLFPNDIEENLSFSSQGRAGADLGNKIGLQRELFQQKERPGNSIPAAIPTSAGR